MKFIRFYGSNGYSGCDYTEYQIFDDDITEEELNEISAELAIAYAESFEYIAAGGLKHMIMLVGNISPPKSMMKIS